jgi:hypothetical protein
MGHQILNGWKEVSSHIERCVRTAQRWELQFGMPVHRPASKRRTAVVAFTDELDTWLVRNRAALNSESHNVSDETNPARLQETLFRLQSEAKELAAKLLYLEQHLQGSSQRDARAEANS